MGQPVTATLLPVPKDDSEMAMQVALEPVDLELDNEGIKKAASELGLMSFKPDRLAAIYSVGKAMKKVGVLKIGRTMLYRAMEGAETGLTQCEDALVSIQDPESRAAILPTKLGFAKELKESAVAFIKSAELDGNDDSDNRGKIKPFGAGMPAGPTIFAQQAVVNTK